MSEGEEMKSEAGAGNAGNAETAGTSEQSRKLFLGGLNYSTNEDGLRNYFSTYGNLVDVVVMRFPDTKRSRGFGFITFSESSMAENCFSSRPHTLDGTEIETKRATPKEEMNKDGADGGEPEAMRKLFIGGLDYATTDEGLRSHFEQYGELVDCVVMKFRDTKRSRGFGFVTYAKSEMVDVCQDARPHHIDGTKVETKRATPREEVGKDSGNAIKKIFVGGLKEGLEDDQVQEYFSQFGNVVKIEQMTEKGTNKKRGFGFVEFDDYDPVDKIILINKHQIGNWKLDVKKAVSKRDMSNMRGDYRDNGPRGGGGYGGHGGGRGGGRNEPNPWGGNQGYGGGYGGNNGGYGGGGNNFGGNSGGNWGGNNGGDNWGNGGGGNNQGGPNPWGGGGGGGSWENQGGGGNWGNNGGNWGGGGGGYNNFGGNQGGPQRGNMGGGPGPMRNNMGGNNRSAPYNMGGGGNRNQGGYVGAGGGYNNRGGGGGGGRW